jgi:hypothetical protein
MMKFAVLMLFVILAGNLHGRQLGEDASNVECTWSIHKSRVYLRNLKKKSKKVKIPDIGKRKKRILSK